jgi:hypothetical protein
MDEGAIDDVVDWRLFVASLCMGGPAPDLPSGAGDALRAAVRAAGASASGRPVEPVLPAFMGVSNTVARNPTRAEVRAMYRAAAAAAAGGADEEEGKGKEGEEDDAAFPPLLIPRAVLTRLRVWWFEGANLVPTTTTTGGKTAAASAGGALAPVRAVSPPGARGGLSRSASPVPLSPAAALAAAAADNSLIGSGWHQAGPSHPGRSHAQVEAQAALRAVADAEARAARSNAESIASAVMTRSSTAGDTVARSALLDAFCMPAGAVFPDVDALEQRGWRAADLLVDASALCTTLMKLAVA